MVTWQSIGLSNKCFPNIICPAIPNIYPFIVNDPGEGSQAKRRTAATIIDHLPLLWIGQNYMENIQY